MSDQDILDAEQVSKLFQCTPEVIEEEARKGTLPGLKFGRSWIFPRSALMQVIHERALAGAEARRTPAPRARFIAPTTNGEKTRRKPLPTLITLPEPASKLAASEARVPTQ